MAESRVITLEMLANQPPPTLVLRPPVVSKKSRSSNWKVLTRDYWNSVAVRANDEMSKLKQDPEELEKNKQQLKKIFDNMKKDAIEKIDAMGNDVMNEMDDLSPEEQKLLIGFWEGVGAFFKEILDWVNTIFRKIVDLFKQGFKLVKETVKKIFQPVTDALKDVWDSLSSAFS